MLTPEEFCFRAAIERRTLQLWLDESWIVPRQRDAGPFLSDIDLARAQLIRELQDGIGVNDEGIGVILNLIDQVHGLRSALQMLMQEVNSGGHSRRA